jgi:hypothetical protein
MLLDRRKMLAATAGLAFLPAAPDMAGPLARRAFVFEPEKGVGEIVSAVIEQRFGVEVDFEHLSEARARSLVDRHPQAYGAIYWRSMAVHGEADLWSPRRAARIIYPYTVRELVGEIEAVTDWIRSAGTPRR